MLVESRVFHRRADAARHQHQNVLLIGREVIQLAAFDIEHPDHAPAVNQRHCEFRANAVESVQVALVFRNVANPYRLAGSSRGTDNPLVHRNAPMFHHFGSMPDGKAKIQLI